MQWFSALLVGALWAVAAGGAKAQIVPLYEYLEFDTFVDLTYTGNGQSVRCTSPNTVGGPRIVEAVLGPEVGAEAVLTQRYFCGDVALDIYRELRVGETRVIDYANVPLWAYFYARISVVPDGGAGESITVGEVQDSFTFPDGTGHWPYINGLNNVPGVVFHNLVDDITGHLAQ
jgi:hypothetical protein